MKDNAIKWLTELNPFDKVKGHTKIELTDVKTGKKQIIEKDNTFQAGVLAKYMRSMGAYNNNPYANGTWAGQPIWRNLCGGIFCFKDPIDLTDGEVEYMPAGNEMVANGAYMVNNAGTPIELGSYNEVESSTSGNDSVTFVYDWMTSQGNGTISCVCLTTEIGGYIGYGNKSGARASAKAFTQNQSSNSLSGDVYKNNRYSFSVDNTNLTLTVTKTPTEVTKGSIFDNIAEDSTEYSYSEAISGTAFNTCYRGNGEFVIYGWVYSGWARLAPNGTWKYLVFNADTGVCTVKTLTNNTTYTLQMDKYSFGANFQIKKHLVAPQWGSGYTAGFEPKIVIDLDTGLKVAEAGDERQIGGNDQTYPWEMMLTDDLVAIPTSTGIMYILDEANGTIYPCNGSLQNLSYNDDLDAFNNGGATYKNPLILATVNNLESPVTKTAAQTMKITYTLTKAVE